MWRKRSLDNDEEWSVSEGVYEGKPIILRVDQGAASLAGDSDLSIQIGIVVPFIEPTDEGFPPPRNRRHSKRSRSQSSDTPVTRPAWWP